MRSFRFLAAAAALLLFSASTAFAHDDAWLATQKAPNGGQLRMAGPYHYELVGGGASGASGGPIVVYVTDHAGTPVPTQGAHGVVGVAGIEDAGVKLAPDGENRLKAAGALAWPKEATVVVSISFAGAPPAQARFAPTAAEGASGSAHSHGVEAGHRH